MSLKEHGMQNPCDNCIYQSQSWNTDPCYKCGSENDYIYGEDADGNLLHPLKEHFDWDE